MKAINMKELHELCKKRTAEIKVGEVYFLSIHHDLDGVWVKVLSKSTELNKAGLPSRVNYRVLKHASVPAHLGRYYTVGSESTCNATNLYEQREFASPIYKFKRAR